MAKGGKLKEFIRKRKWRIRMKTWMLFVILVPLLIVDATLLRQDHIKMTELRDAVLKVDESINADDEVEDTAEIDAEIAATLTELKEFVFHNIVVNVVEENGRQRVTFGTGPFYLEHQYIRAAKKALAEAEEKLTSDNNPNGNIYGKASEVCRPQAIKNGWSWSSPNYINCMMSEIQKYPAADDIQDTIEASLPSTELFRKNYASPVWAPTLTGVTLLITAVVLLLIIIRAVMWVVLRIALFFV